MSDAHDKTALFRYKSVEDESAAVRTVLQDVYAALQERGYNPFGQIVGYLISGDPTFITSHKNARTLIAQIERDIILEELVKHYLKE
ncbi:MAG TPA: IreB family regulatory phosphoprotein [Firmicutes bacterium]|nr:IreB family regulatory phosphoprotein [Bacillota bacterium]